MKMRQKIHRTNPLPVLGLFGVITVIVISILIFSPYSWNQDSLILLIGIILLDNIVYFGLVKGTYIILENNTLTSVSWLFVKVKMDILNIKKILFGMGGLRIYPGIIY